MGANARRCSQMQKRIIASRRELPVKTLNICIPNCNLYFYLFREGILHLRDSVKYFDYFRVTLSCNSVYRERVERYYNYRSLLRALEAERNRVRC